ncbi:hypothetical protein [Enterobacter sp. Bisph1]|uniref:hypothetical protein n=1 Tax=Enterobacter sp. Bisph1 TaxID=1274399 RepID=UPI00057BEE30|nr:hypothetical protein [Enterobacter sp. Bisph1]
MRRNRIDPKVNGIHDALHLKKDKALISDRTMNKLLQILYDDLRDAHNIVFTNHTRERLDNPSAHLTRDLAVRFIHQAVRPYIPLPDVPLDIEALNSPRLLPGEICKVPGFDVCRVLIGKMFTKLLFLHELLKAKELLNGSQFNATDPRRREILEYIKLVAQKVVQQVKQAVTETRLKMQRMELFRNGLDHVFNNAVLDSYTIDFLNNKTQINMLNNGISMERKVYDFRPLSTTDLQERINEFLGIEGVPVASAPPPARVAPAAQSSRSAPVTPAAPAAPVARAAPVAQASSSARRSSGTPPPSSSVPLLIINDTISLEDFVNLPAGMNVLLIPGATRQQITNEFNAAAADAAAEARAAATAADARRAAAAVGAEEAARAAASARPADFGVSTTTHEQIKEMAMWEKLKDLANENSVKYPSGTEVTLYFVKQDNDVDWYTKEECLDKKLNATDSITKQIPTEEQYRIAMEQLRQKYVREREAAIHAHIVMQR